MFKPLILVLMLIFSSAQAFGDYQDFNLQRMVRAQKTPALLVPYPRIGKRSESNVNNYEVQKRLYMARVGKRSYMYAARVGR